MKEIRDTWCIRRELRRAAMQKSDLENEMSIALCRDYLKRAEKLRQTPIEEVIEQAYEDNKKVDWILARRKKILQKIQEYKEKGLNTYLLESSNSLGPFPEYGLPCARINCLIK